jgi:hypothetical protein
VPKNGHRNARVNVKGGEQRPAGAARVCSNLLDPGSCVRHHECMFSDDERRQYTARQYQSLREEITQAREAQQSILLWNQAVSGTLFAAALVAETSNSARYVIAVQFVFGLVLPAVLLGGALAWSGEMIRMERAGVYLRSFERATWNSEGEDGYAGVGVFYGIMYVGSLVAFCTISVWWLSLIACITLVVLALAVMIFPAIQLFTLGGSSPTLTADGLANWMEELDESKGLLAQSGTLIHIKTLFTRRGPQSL